MNITQHSNLKSVNMTNEEDVYDALRYRVTVDRFGTRRYRNAEGRYHREGGPAVIFDNGDKIWYHNGLRHREVGPAVERSNGRCEWWINGKQCPQAEFHEQLKSLEIKDG